MTGAERVLKHEEFTMKDMKGHEDRNVFSAQCINGKKIPDVATSRAQWFSQKIFMALHALHGE